MALLIFSASLFNSAPLTAKMTVQELSALIADSIHDETITIKDIATKLEDGGRAKYAKLMHAIVENADAFMKKEKTVKAFALRFAMMNFMYDIHSIIPTFNNIPPEKLEAALHRLHKTTATIDEATVEVEEDSAPGADVSASANMA